MKNILLLISFFCVALLGLKAQETTSLQEQGERYVCVISPSLDNSYGDMAITDAEVLAGSMRVCGRNHRSFNLAFSYMSKVMAWKTAINRINALSHAFSLFYNTMPHPSWKLSSDHYIFELRHILI